MSIFVSLNMITLNLKIIVLTMVLTELSRVSVFLTLCIPLFVGNINEKQTDNHQNTTL
jgi:hypothetical protein